MANAEWQQAWLALQRRVSGERESSDILAGSDRPAGIFLMAASASVIAAMIYAATWALGEYPLQPMTDLSHMERIHGVLNAAGFGVFGTLGWIRFRRAVQRHRNFDEGMKQCE